MRRGLVGGTTSSLLSTAALSAFGQHDAGSAYVPTNAVSHWIWGERAVYRHAPSARYTLPGYLIHHGCATFWAVIFERVCGELLDRKHPALTLGAGSAASALACFADYQLTPRRFRPGFERTLSRPSLAGVYAVFGIGLALGAMLSRR